MTTTIDAELISSTKNSLSKVIKKPVATEKLLQRPPFKFIQDVILSVSIFKLLVIHNELIFKYNSSSLDY